jgi:arylsulfate sulfotransferase
MKVLRLRVWSVIFSGVLLTFVTVGCGSGSSGTSNPESSIVATQNALVAQYNLTLPIPSKNLGAWVEFGTDTTYGRQTSTTAPTTSLGPQTIGILVAGMKPSTTYHMRAHVEWYGGGSWVDQDQTFTTGSLSSVGLVAPKIAITLPSKSLSPNPGVELIDGLILGPPNPSLLTTFVTDLQGNVIWYYPVGSMEGYKLMPSGYFAANLGSDLREFDLAGNTVNDVSMNQVNASLQSQGYPFQITGFHHDLLLLPNGHWIGLANILKSFTNLPGFPGVTNVLSDVLVDIDPGGNVGWAWSAFDHLDINRQPMGLVPFQGAGGATGGDWTHSNALQYTADGNLLLSMRAQSWILKIDYENGAGSGDVLWRLGYQGDFTISGGDSREWFYAQHDPVIMNTNGSQMTLSIWDNGNLRINPDGTSCNQYQYTQPLSCYSRATIFQIDENAKMANLVWQDLPNLYSFWGGAAEALSNGDFEFDLTDAFVGPKSRVLEVTQTDNPQTVWQMDLTGENAYRGFRIPSLYPGVTWQK